MNQVKNTSSKSSLSSAGRTLVSAQKKPRLSLKRGKVRAVTGQVISNKASKTLSVLVYRLMKHKKYKKYIRKKSVFKAHDEREQAQTGDMVRIYETRPLSKTKRWRLLKVIKPRQPVHRLSSDDEGGEV